MHYITFNGLFKIKHNIFYLVILKKILTSRHVPGVVSFDAPVPLLPGNVVVRGEVLGVAGVSPVRVGVTPVTWGGLQRGGESVEVELVRVSLSVHLRHYVLVVVVSVGDVI